MVHDRRWDRLAIRALVAVALVLAVTDATRQDGSTQLPTWRVAASWSATAIFALALLLGDEWWRSGPGRGKPRWSWPSLVTLSLMSLALGLLAPTSGLVWVPFAALVVINRSLEPRDALMVNLPPLAAVMWVAWAQSHDVSRVVINVVAAVGVIGLVQLGRMRQDAVQLAAAQAQVIAQERARSEAAEHQQAVAAQLHDVLAHTLSGLIVTLQTTSLAARAEGVSPALQSRLDVATGLAREGLVGAREAVESLHGAPPADAAAIDLAAWLRTTVARLRTNADVDVTVEGHPGDIPAAGVAVAQAVVREALTNSLRHAAGRPVRITLQPRRIDVLSVGDVAAYPVTDQVSGGHGLDGLRGRVAATRGRLEAGPTPDGWLVSAQWPQP